MKKIFCIISLCFIALRSFCQTDFIRLQALSMIESGDNDTKIGSRGEVSRFQIMPAVWRFYAGDRVNWRNPFIARGVTVKIMRDRVRAFEIRYGRLPSDFEWAFLWHRPAYVLAPTLPQVHAHQAKDIDYAIRFRNLVYRYSH